MNPRYIALRQILGRIGLWLSVFVIVSPAILFFLWMASLSLKFEIDNASYPPVFFPEHIAWKNYADVFASNRFLTYFTNSLVVTGCATGLAMLVGVPAGYGIARMAAHKSAIVILIARITPGLSYLIPLFLLFQWLGLLGTLVPQIIIHLVVTVPIVIWIMIGYFASIPKELDEAAIIDGASWFQTLTRIFIPVALPGLIAATIFAFTVSWAQFLYPLVFTTSTDQLVLPVGIITTLIKGDVFNWGQIMTGALLGAAPPLIIYAFLMDYYIAGLTAGATKG